MRAYQTLLEAGTRKIVCRECGQPDLVREEAPEVCKPCRRAATLSDLEWARQQVDAFWGGGELPLIPPEDRRRTTQYLVSRRLPMLAWYICHVIFSRLQTDIGRAAGKDRTTIANGVEQIEELRETPSVDDALNLIEGMAQKRIQVAA